MWFGMDAPSANVISSSMCNTSQAAKLVTSAIKGTGKHCLALEVGWKDMRSRRPVHKVILHYKIVNNVCPDYL